jgi:uncharacterized protein (DUF885 family)
MKKQCLILLVVFLVSACGGGQKAAPEATPSPTPLAQASPKFTAEPTIAATATLSPVPSAPSATLLPAESPAALPTMESTAAPAPLDLSGASPAVVALVGKLQGLDFDTFFDRAAIEMLLRDPEAVVTAGLTDALGVTDAKLTDISDAYIRESYQMVAVILDLLHRYDRAALSPEQQISYDIYEWWLQDRLAGQAFMYADYPATYFPVTAVHEQLVDFFTDIHPVANLQDARDYVTRLGQVGVKLDQLLEGLELREQAGIIPPKFAIQWAVYGSLGGLIETPARQTPFYEALAVKLDTLEGVSDADQQAVLADAEKAITEVVLPAYTELADYMRRLESVAPSDDGVWQFPDGAAYYAYLLHHYTTTDMSADEIHALGLQELERIHAEMRVLFDELGYPQDESLPDLFDRVAADSGHISGQQVLETYEQLIAQAEQNLDAAFDVRPQAPVIVVADDFGGFYIGPSFDGSRPGAFYAGVGGAGEDYYGMPTLAYHEAVPGHHLQIALAQEMDLPAFRRDAPFIGYIEGWALYAERLAWELGWYEGDPYGNLGRLQAEAFRAARLVVDTGIHAQGWDFERAEKFFTENVGYEVGDIVNPQHQIARYVVWPGQATAYYVGMLKILELRQRAMDQLGERFDLQEFHRVVLGNGSVPLEVLERVVERYIQEKK